MADGTLPATAGTTAAARVGEIMTAPVVSVSPETPTAEIAEVLARHRISGVPVLDGTGGSWGWSASTTCSQGPGRPRTR